MREPRLVFGDEADLYDRVRPSHPADLIDEILALVDDPCGRSTPAAARVRRHSCSPTHEERRRIVAEAIEHVERQLALVRAREQRLAQFAST